MQKEIRIPVFSALVGFLL